MPCAIEILYILCCIALTEILFPYLLVNNPLVLFIFPFLISSQLSIASFAYFPTGNTLSLFPLPRIFTKLKSDSNDEIFMFTASETRSPDEYNNSRKALSLMSEKVFGSKDNNFSTSSGVSALGRVSPIFGD